ncbi:MAG: MarR family transcriptional regulator, partial [Myxococcota bacterium]
MTNPTHLKSNDVARLLRDALRRLLVAHHSFDEHRRPCGLELSAPYAWALLELSDRGPLTVKELSEQLNIDKTNVSRLCAKMEAQGHVCRPVHPDDGRARLVELTRAGRVLASRTDEMSSTHFSELLAELDLEPVIVIETLNALSSSMKKSADK